MKYFDAILVFLITSLIVGFIGSLFYLIYLPFRNKLLKIGKLTNTVSKQINIVYILVLLGIAGFGTYSAFFPDDDFYFGEFSDVTLLEAPKSAKIIRKALSYPDFHGDYCSSSLIKLSNKDHDELLKNLQNNKQMKNCKSIIGDHKFQEILNSTKTKQVDYCFQRNILGKEDQFLFIGFINNQSVIILKCLT